MKRKQLSNSEIKDVEKILHTLYGNHSFFSKKDRVALEERAGFTLLLVNETPFFFYLGDLLVPLLSYLMTHTLPLKKIVVDSGAIRFVVNGADIMRPGIVSIDSGILKGEITLVTEITHGKNIALGESLYSTDEAQQLITGKIVRNIHYVGDPLWNATKSV